MSRLNVLRQILAAALIFGFASLALTGCDDLIGKDDAGSSAITPEEIRLSSSELTLLIGGTETLISTVLPANAANKAVNWNSSNPQVAAVASNGAVTGLSLGTATVIATTADGGKTASCAVSVIEGEGIAPANISLFPSSLVMNIGDTENIIVTVTPSNAVNDVYWKSENPAVVVVGPDGKITAMGEGAAAVYALSVVGGRQASCNITVNPPLVSIIPVNKYEVIGDTSEDVNDRVKYSFSYGDIDYYYIYLGEMQHIPLFYYAAYNHDGMASSYSVSRTETTKETIETTVAESSQTAVTVSENYSTSSTNGGKVSAEISNKFTVNVKLSGKLFGIGGEAGTGYEYAAKEAAESYWSTVNTSSGGSSSQKSKSLTNTVKNGTEKTESTQETRTWNFTKNEKTGWYRYTLFSASDVYLYVIRDRAVPSEIYYEFREHVIPDVYFWKMDYSDNASFNKDDETRFNFNVSMLDNLPATKHYNNEFFVTNTDEWNRALDLIRIGGSGTRANPKDYTITVADRVAVTGGTENTFSNVANIAVTLNGNGTLYLGSQGSLINVGGDQTVCIDHAGLTLQGLKAGQNGALVNNNRATVSVSSTGKLELKDGRINGNVTTANTGSVHIFNGGTFTMNGGFISGNTSSGQGGGVYVDGGAFTMNGGAIKDNNATRGGGVLAINKSSFTMVGGVISDNTVSGWAGGVAVDYNSSFIMAGGNITGNEAFVNAGGVEIAENSTFTMNGGAINNNTTSESGGGVVLYLGCTFTMNGGFVSDNKSLNGGGVYVTQSTFTMTGSSTISGNTANDSGGGVWVDNGTFTMTGGTISKNTAATLWGGGVFVHFTSNGRFIKTGGTITGYANDKENGNRALNRDNGGHAAYVYTIGRRRDTTAGPGNDLDASKDGSAGGWVN